MNKAVKEFIHFVESAQGFDSNCKLKLILFAAGAKPSTYIVFRAGAQNLDEKFHFEKHLRAIHAVFEGSKGKTFEEIDCIRQNIIQWSIKGMWYGYDLFHTKKQLHAFDNYVQLMKKQQHTRADIIAGTLYGYPSCCVKAFTNEKNSAYLKKNYTFYQYSQKMHQLDRTFPFLTHTPCTVTCKESKKLNALYQKTISAHAPRFWKAYTKKTKTRTAFIVDGETDLYQDNLFKAKSIWEKKDGHQYSLIATKPINKHYYLFPYLSKKNYERGALLEGTALLQYDYANITITKQTTVIKNLRHNRRLPALIP